MRDEHTGEALGQFAADILMEIEADRTQLDSIVERVGGGSVLKETTGWLGAKLARFKVGRDVAGDLGTLEALEAVALGIQGKRALWNALRTVATPNASLGVYLDRLAARAEAQ